MKGHWLAVLFIGILLVFQTLFSIVAVYVATKIAVREAFDYYIDKNATWPDQSDSY